MCKISVVIPLYNKEKHIKRCIDSVLSQSYQSFEIIVVDDGSTDNGVAIVKQYSDSRIRLIQQQNSGVSSARNKGILESNYDYIAFLDADDSWKMDFLDSGIKLINKFPSAGAYSFGYEVASSENMTRKVKFLSIPNTPWEGILENFFEMMLGNPPVWSSAVIIPKHVFNKIGVFKDGETIGEDVEMWCRIALSYKIAFNNSIKATYFLDSDNRAYVRGKKVKKPQGYIDTLNDALKDKTLSNKLKIDIHNLLERIKLGQGIFKYFSGDTKNARKNFTELSSNKYKYQKILWIVITYFPVSFTEFLIRFKNKLRR